MTIERKLTRAEQKERRPLQILDAAFEEFVTHGYAAARVEDIAARVGVTKGTVYVYFETKERLFEAMIRHISVSFAEIMDTSEKLIGTPAERLETLLRLLYDRDGRGPRELLRMVISEGPKFPEMIARHEKEFIEPLMRKISAILQEGVAAGQFRAEPSGFAEIVMAPVMSLTVMRLISDDRRIIDQDAYIQTHIDLILHGLMRN